MAEEIETLLPVVGRKTSVRPGDTLYEEIMQMFRWTCTWHGCWMPATCLHHEPPKSIAGETTGIFPACNEHHEAGHSHRDIAPEKFRTGALEVLDFYSEGRTRVLPFGNVFKDACP